MQKAAADAETARIDVDNNPVADGENLSTHTVYSIHGQNVRELSARPSSRHLTFAPAVPLPGQESKRHLTVAAFEAGPDPRSFTLRGSIGPTPVIVKVTDYRSNGPESVGNATVELMPDRSPRLRGLSLPDRNLPPHYGVVTMGVVPQ